MDRERAVSPMTALREAYLQLDLQEIFSDEEDERSRPLLRKGKPESFLQQEHEQGQEEQEEQEERVPSGGHWRSAWGDWRKEAQPTSRFTQFKPARSAAAAEGDETIEPRGCTTSTEGSTAERCERNGCVMAQPARAASRYAPVSL